MTDPKLLKYANTIIGKTSIGAAAPEQNGPLVSYQIAQIPTSGYRPMEPTPSSTVKYIFINVIRNDSQKTLYVS
jgi:hypothetical protein